MRLMKNKALQTAGTNLRTSTLLVAMIATTSLIGCKATGLTFPTSLGGNTNATRVPAPATGSFQVPGSYSGAVGSPPATGLGSSSFSSASTGPVTSQTMQPVSNLLSGLQNAQSQFRTATNQAFDRVNRASVSAQGQVEQASARIDRIGEGVSQASAIVSDSLTAPIENGVYIPPNPSLPSTNPPSLGKTGSSGTIGDSLPSAAPTWRAPSTSTGN